MGTFRTLLQPLVRRRAGVVVLSFHGAQLASPGDARRCADQIERVVERARVITLDEAVRGLSREDPAVAHSMVITVDDVSAAFAAVVVPVLVRHHVPATMFLTTSLVGDESSARPEPPPISWSRVNELVGTGVVTLGSRSHTGATLERASATAASAEIGRSIDLITERTGRTPAHFAYPGGLAGSPEADALVRAHFHSASAGRGRINVIGRTDVHGLVRPVVTPRMRRLELDGLIRAAGPPPSRGPRDSASWPGTLDAPGR